MNLLDSRILTNQAHALLAEAATIDAEYGKCKRCAGTGTTQWKHIEGGMCFKCEGTGAGPMPKAKALEARGLEALARETLVIAEQTRAREKAEFDAHAAAAGVDPAEDFLAALLAQPTF